MNCEKIIYLGTTNGCSSCKCQEHILDSVLKDRNDVNLQICNHTKLPEWIKTNVNLTDFPVTIIVEDNKIKYHFVGTRPIRDIKTLLVDINF